MADNNTVKICGLVKNTNSLQETDLFATDVYEGSSSNSYTTKSVSGGSIKEFVLDNTTNKNRNVAFNTVSASIYALKEGATVQVPTVGNSSDDNNAASTHWVKTQLSEGIFNEDHTVSGEWTFNELITAKNGLKITNDVVLESRNGNTVLCLDNSKKICSSTVSISELAHLESVSSNVQGQLDNKMPLRPTTIAMSGRVENNIEYGGSINFRNPNNNDANTSTIEEKKDSNGKCYIYQTPTKLKFGSEIYYDDKSSYIYENYSLSSNYIPTVQYIKDEINRNGNVVHRTEAESVSGVKTFINRPILSNGIQGNCMFTTATSFDMVLIGHPDEDGGNWTKGGCIALRSESTGQSGGIDFIYGPSGDRKTISIRRGQNIEIVEPLIINNTNDIKGDSYNNPPLCIGNRYGQHLEIDDNEIESKWGSTSVSSLYINSDGGDVEFHTISNCGIGIYSNNLYFKIAKSKDNFSQLQMMGTHCPESYKARDYAPLYINYHMKYDESTGKWIGYSPSMTCYSGHGTWDHGTWDLADGANSRYTICFCSNEYYNTNGASGRYIPYYFPSYTPDAGASTSDVATTKWTQDAIGNYLYKYGNVGKSKVICTEDDTGILMLRAHTPASAGGTNSNGAYINLWGGNSANPGCFELAAQSNTGAYYLQGWPNGSLVWIHYVTNQQGELVVDQEPLVRCINGTKADSNGNVTIALGTTDDSKLPIAGGTMTGVLNLPSNNSEMYYNGNIRGITDSGGYVRICGGTTYDTGGSLTLDSAWNADSSALNGNVTIRTYSYWNTTPPTIYTATYTFSKYNTIVCNYGDDTPGTSRVILPVAGASVQSYIGVESWAFYDSNDSKVYGANVLVLK